MKIIKYQSQCTPQLNTKIMRSIESLVCRHRAILPNGWRCIIEFQRYNDNDTEPYYILDIQSNQGGGDYAAAKMEMLKHFPDRAATGGDTPDDFCKILEDFKSTHRPPGQRIPSDLADPILNKLIHLNRLSELDSDYWDILKRYGLTHWYGGIRIPYDILVTEHGEAFLAGEKGKQHVNETTGEIRIAFSGAKEWEDVFIAFCIFGNLQNTLNELWDRDQIWFNLRGIENDPHLAVWLDLLDIHEA